MRYLSNPAPAERKSIYSYIIMMDEFIWWIHGILSLSDTSQRDTNANLSLRDAVEEFGVGRFRFAVQWCCYVELDLR